MAYKDAPNPPPLTLPAYWPTQTAGVPMPNLWQVRSGGGSLTSGMTTQQPFTVASFAIARGLPLNIAQAVLDQAVIDGRIIIV